MGNFSPQTIEALAMTITGGSFSGSANPVPSKYRAGWELEQFFKGIEVPFKIDKESRVPAVRECLEGLNVSDPVKIEEAIQAVCDPREYLDNEDNIREIVDYLNKRLKFDGFELWKEGEFYRLVSTDIVGAPANALQATINLTDYDSVKTDFERAVSAIEKDPEDAITAACSIVESICKCILDQMKKPYPKKQDIKGLVAEVGKHLHLSPARSNLPSEISGDIKQILSGLINVTSGIGALRTHGGDAHGRGRKRVPVDARIARLAIHAASTVSLFYIETWNRITATRKRNDKEKSKSDPNCDD